MSNSSSLYDQSSSFGWISIALHWSTAVAVIALWLVGKSISWLPAEDIDARRSLHIMIGLIAWLPLVLRIVWRWKVKHPRAFGQSARTHTVARVTHYLILAALAVMILSGPVMAFFLPEANSLTNIALTLHANAANVLLMLIVLHVGGALKHLMFHDDETVARIFVPRRNGSANVDAEDWKKVG
ncbi:MAG: cytochrome b/b6 domain-containing protein [Gammaproteobacteria bacterium]|nr:cytochrome b/b6 domain-containing protein [Gammaproteobacteria bacterium]MDP2347316.1 cytochrome b/b6 domain-containing protein [Gammaproteobacteria bacterium]